MELRQGFFAFLDDLWTTINLRNEVLHYRLPGSARNVAGGPSCYWSLGERPLRYKVTTGIDADPYSFPFLTVATGASLLCPIRI